MMQTVPAGNSAVRQQRATGMIKAQLRRLQRGKILKTGLEAMHDI